MSTPPALERCVCLSEGVAHVIRADESRAACGVSPVLRLSRMGDWQEAWRARVERYDLCRPCVAETGFNDATAGATL